jgi:hypothetical protein
MRIKKYFALVALIFAIFSVQYCSPPDLNEDHMLFPEYWTPLMDDSSNAYVIWRSSISNEDFTVSGDYIYYCNMEDLGMFSVLDVSDKADIRLVGALTNHYGHCLAVNGEYCYMASTNDLLVYSIADPANPERLGNMEGRMSNAGAFQSIVVYGGYLYVDTLKDGTNYLITLDLSTPASPAVTSISTNATTITKIRRIYATKNWLVQWLGYGNTGNCGFISSRIRPRLSCRTRNLFANQERRRERRCRLYLFGL